MCVYRYFTSSDIFWQYFHTFLDQDGSHTGKNGMRTIIGLVYGLDTLCNNELLGNVF